MKKEYVNWCISRALYGLLICEPHHYGYLQTLNTQISDRLL